MATLRAIEIELAAVKDLALLDSDDAVWLVVALRWWDLATILWWFLCPSDRKARVKLTISDGRNAKQVVMFRAVRVASRHVKVRGQLKGE